MSALSEDFFRPIVRTRYLRVYRWEYLGPRFAAWRERDLCARCGRSNWVYCFRVGFGRHRFHISIGRVSWL